MLNPRRARLATRLRAVRAAAFRSGNALARELGWVQSRVSKLETGTQMPTEDDVRAWTRATRAGPEVEVELLQLLADARVEYVNARDVILGDGLAGRQASLVVGEAALHSPPGSRDTLRGQLDRLVALTGLATLDLRVLPLAAPMPAMPLSGFTIHDTAFVLIETLTGEQRLDQPDEVGVYAQAFDRLSSAALAGERAADLLRQIMSEP